MTKEPRRLNKFKYSSNTHNDVYSILNRSVFKKAIWKTYNGDEIQIDQIALCIWIFKRR